MKRYVAIDTETFLIEPGNVCPRLVCLSVADSINAADLYTASEAKEIFTKLIEDPEVILIGQNIAFDLLVLAKPWGLMDEVFKAYDDKRIRDTGIRERLIDIKNGRTDTGLVWYPEKQEFVKKNYSLSSLVLRYLDKDISESKTDPNAWRLRYSELAGMPIAWWPQEAADYAKNDARYTLAVFNCQSSEVDGHIDDETEQVYGAWALHLIAARGIKVDREKAEALSEKMLSLQKKTRRRLVSTGLLRPKKLTAKQRKEGKSPDLFIGNIPYVYSKDTKKISDYVVRQYKKIGVPLKLTATGKIPTDKDTLTESGSHILALLSEEGGVDKIISTYLPVLRSGYDSAICCGYEPLVNSGRCSSYKPNLQNIPSGRRIGGVRECFVPRPGFLLCSVDFDTLELRALAQVCLWLFGQSKMADSLNSGLDLHLMVGAQLLGIDYDEAKLHIKDVEVESARDVAKVANFGFPGGLGPKKFVDYARKSYRVRVTEEKAREVYDTWKRVWPEMRLYHNEIKQLTEGGEGTILQLGTKRVRGMCRFTEAANTLFQGLAGSGAKKACAMVTKEAYTSTGSLRGLYPIAMVHDELVCEVDIDTAIELGEELTRVMIEGMQKLIPDVKITAKPTYMKFWTKDKKQHLTKEQVLTLRNTSPRLEASLEGGALNT